MKTDVEEWKERLGSLEAGERAELALFLIGSLGPMEEGAESAWDEVASKRVQRIYDGMSRGRDAGAFLTELHERLP
jgi:hypothetical protein